MNPQEVKRQLSIFLGLDDASIGSLYASLEGLKSRAELEDFLTGLLGFDGPQAGFIRSYTSSRFPERQKAPEQSSSRPSSSMSSHPHPLSGAIASSSKPSSRVSTPSGGQASSLRPIQHTSQAMPAHITVSGSASSTPSTSRGPSPVPSFSASPAPVNVGGLKSKAPEGASVEAIRELKKIDRNLKYARGLGKTVACFCQGQEHPVSPISPLCPRCLLVICDLNVPYTSPCPSCTFEKLASKDTLDSFVKAQEIKRDQIIRSEIARVQFESEEEERLRRAVQFPGLEAERLAAVSGRGGASSAMAYSNKLGGSRDYYTQIDQAYKRQIEAEEKFKAHQERKVLSLNNKTGKAKVITTGKAKKAGESAAGKVDKKAEKEDDWEDKRKPYIDEYDDGFKDSREEADKSPGELSGYAWPMTPSGLVYGANRGTTSVG